jgi:hypothetical protein
MGDYLSVALRFRGGGRALALLEPFFSSSFFTPVAIGGVASSEDGPRWLIGGYVVEPFLTHLISVDRQRTPAVEILEEPRIQNHEYLVSMARRVRDRTIPSSTFSPHELRDPATGVTFLPSIRLSASALEGTQEWLSRFPYAIVYVYGSVNIAVRQRDHHPWNMAFRFPISENPTTVGTSAPFLYVWGTTRSLSPDTTDVQLYGQSRIWLRGALEFEGLVGEQEADQNLANLAALAGSIIEAGEDTLVAGEIRVKGRLYRRELDRISAVFPYHFQIELG